MPHNVIIGGGPAATNAIETLRQLEETPSEITLISDEVAHSRMAIPYWLSGQIPREQTHTGDDAYFERLNVQTKFGVRVDAIDAAAKTVTTNDGQSVSYDQLLLATGSTPMKLPVEGGDLPGVTPKWNLRDVERGLEILEGKKNPKVVLVGAGFIGFIILSSLYKRGCDLTVVERESNVLPRMLSSHSAQFVERWLEQKKVKVHTETSVTGITEASDGSKRVATTSGEIEADLVVVAVGVNPNTQLGIAAGLKTDHGILVNANMQTSDLAIFAAGDCAQGPSLLGGDAEVHAIHPTAVDHGRVAGANMAGKSVSYPGSLSMNVLDVCGLQCVSYGHWNDTSAESFEISSEATNVYRNLLWSGDKISGAMFVGQANNVGMLTDVGMIKGLIQTQTSLGDWKAFLKQNPFDIRRAFIGSGVGEKLRKTTLLGQAAATRKFHFGDAKPKAVVTPHHASYVGQKPS